MRKIFSKATRVILPFIPFCLALETGVSWASDAATVQTCFDFGSPVKQALRKMIPLKINKDVSESGKLPSPKSALWGAARGAVNASIKQVYEMLLDHYTIKSPEKTKLKVFSQDREGYQDFHVVMVTLPLPVMDVKWEEEWGYVIAEGQATDPKSIVISYQKTNGSKFIPHLCGSIVLNSTDAHHTDVYLYEEIDALGKRSHKDTVAGHIGTLTTLRQKAKQLVASTDHH